MTPGARLALLRRAREAAVGRQLLGADVAPGPGRTGRTGRGRVPRRFACARTEHGSNGTRMV